MSFVLAKSIYKLVELNTNIMETVQFEQLISVGFGIDFHKNVIAAKIRSSNSDYQTKSSTLLQVH
jgi:hypothetical protein